MFRRLFRLAGAAFLSASLLSALGAPLDAQTAAPTPAAAAVLVVGGTPAGVAAAVAAARAGQDVTLVARRRVLGGILTDAMMDQWDFNLAPDGAPVQGGLFREIHAALGDAFTPAAAAQVFGALVAREPRIRLVTDARAVEVATRPSAQGRTVTGVRFRRGDGAAFELAAGTVVDATDDGDVAALAGARYDLGRQDTGVDERMQPVTLMFTVRGVDWARLAASYDKLRYGNGGATDRRAWGYGKLLREYRPLSEEVYVRDLNLGREPGGEVTVNAIDVLGIDGRSDADVARARAISERETPALVAWLRERLPGFEDAAVGRYAQAVYVRETRHFAGVEQLTADDVWAGRIPSDSIGLSSYPLDLHPVSATDRLAYAPVRHVYGIPFGALVPRDLANVVLASPAISATHIAAGSARVIPTTIEEGEAAGVAAALAQRERTTVAAMARDPDARRRRARATAPRRRDPELRHRARAGRTAPAGANPRCEAARGRSSARPRARRMRRFQQLAPAVPGHPAGGDGAADPGLAAVRRDRGANERPQRRHQLQPCRRWHAAAGRRGRHYADGQRLRPGRDPGPARERRCDRAATRRAHHLHRLRRRGLPAGRALHRRRAQRPGVVPARLVHDELTADERLRAERSSGRTRS